jgi:hypothetical protein
LQYKENNNKLIKIVEENKIKIGENDTYINSLKINNKEKMIQVNSREKEISDLSSKLIEAKKNTNENEIDTNYKEKY